MKKKILIAGGAGLIGSRLVKYLSHADYHFNILTRSDRKDTDHVSYYKWNTSDRTLDEQALEGVVAIVNLAGAGIADKRWTAVRKREIIGSRVDSALTLAKTMAERGGTFPTYIGASAVGYYGNTGDRRMTENASAGTGFLAEVTEQWEEAHDGLKPYFDRSILLRIGIVLSEKGGALKEMLKPARAGVYGYFGNGQAYYSWVHIDDICEMIKQAIVDDSYAGTYNATAPEPITIKELVIALKKAKGGSGLVVPVPTIGLKLAMGEMTQMLTDSMRVIPQRLMDQDYQFLFDNPEVALKDILRRNI